MPEEPAVLAARAREEPAGDEDLTRTVFAQQPYASDTGRDTFNNNDGIFSDKTI